jgi:hypothetical protein
MEWLSTTEGSRVLSTVIFPALAIVVAGLIGALIGRGSTKRVIAQYNRDALTAAVQGLVLAGRKAANWNAIGTTERVQVDHLIGEAETRIRLLPVSGAALAANWAAHQLEDMKRNSAGFSFQAQQTLSEYRDRLIAWSEKPRQAKKLFGADLERWKYDTDPAEQALLAEQSRWESEHRPEREVAAVASAPAVLPPADRPAAQHSPAPRPDDTMPVVVSTPFAPPYTTSASPSAEPAIVINDIEDLADMDEVEPMIEPMPTQLYVTDQRVDSPRASSSADAPPPMSANNVRERIDARDTD